MYVQQWPGFILMRTGINMFFFFFFLSLLVIVCFAKLLLIYKLNQQFFYISGLMDQIIYLYI